MATFYRNDGGEFGTTRWVSYDWGTQYGLAVSTDPDIGPSSRYEALEMLYIPLANADAGGGVSLAIDQANALIAKAPLAWSALGIEPSNVTAALEESRQLNYARLYNLNNDDFIDVIGKGLTVAFIGAGVGSLAGAAFGFDLPSLAGLGGGESAVVAPVGEVSTAFDAWDFSVPATSTPPVPAGSGYDLLKGIPDDIGYDFTPGPSLLDAAPAASTAASTAAQVAKAAAPAALPALSKLADSLIRALSPVPAASAAPVVTAQPVGTASPLSSWLFPALAVAGLLVVARS